MTACETVGWGAFMSCPNLSGTISLPNCITISGRAFMEDYKITSVYAPQCETIGENAFYHCSSLARFNMSLCRSISTRAFWYCTSLSSVSLPVCETIGDDAFYSCNISGTLSLPECTYIGRAAFAYNSRITAISLPNCLSMDGYVFSNCSITNAYLPKCTAVGFGVFRGWSVGGVNNSPLRTLSMPALVDINNYGYGNGAFDDLVRLTTASFVSLTRMGDRAFMGCWCLISLYLLGSSVCVLDGSAAFSSTPIAGYSASTKSTPHIYVKQSLLTAYKTAANWSYFASRFVGM